MKETATKIHLTQAINFEIISLRLEAKIQVSKLWKKKNNWETALV